MPSQYVTSTVTWTSGGTSYTTNMFVAQYGTRGPAKGRRWYTCQMCGLDYPAEKVILRGGVAYCLPLKCYRDLEPEWSP